MTAVLFLGGWLSPLPFPPFTWIPGVIWFLIKAWSVVFMLLDGHGLRARAIATIS